MLRAALLAAVFLPLPADAACHKFSLWRYPWPQNCGLILKPAPAPKRIYRGPPEPPAILPPTKDFALPDTVFIAAKPADEETALRLLGRGRSEENTDGR